MFTNGHFFSRMPGPWVRYRSPGCGACISPDRHQECLQHSPSTWNHTFQPPKRCMCSAAVVALVCQPPCLGFSTSLHLIKTRWQNLQKLASEDHQSAFWASHQLPLLLGISHPQSFPIPLFSALLDASNHTKRSFSGSAQRMPWPTTKQDSCLSPSLLLRRRRKGGGGQLDG